MRLRATILILASLALIAQQPVPGPIVGGGGSGGAASGSAYAAVTDGSPITWALGSAYVLNGSITLAHGTATRALNITGPTSGGFYTLIVKQDSTGGALLTLGTGCTWKVGGGGAGLVTLTATASAIDILTFTYDGTNCYANVQNSFN